jgi:hypothetical protein
MTKREMARFIVENMFPAGEGDTERKRNRANEMVKTHKKADLEELLVHAQLISIARGSDS